MTGSRWSPPAAAIPHAGRPAPPLGELIRRVYELDPLVRPRCRGGMRVVSFITKPRLIRRILDHLDASAPSTLFQG